MSKRKISNRQAWRLKKIQDERLERAQKKQHHETEHLTPEQLGHEQSGLVIANYGVKLIVEDESNCHRVCHARQNLGSIVVGDRVAWQRIDENTGVVVACKPRDNLLERPMTSGETKAVAANIEQIIILFSPFPELQSTLLDQYLVATEEAKIKAIIIANKIDLFLDQQHAEVNKLLRIYEEIGYTTHSISVKQNIGIQELRLLLRNQTSILVGQSGVGKSSTINTLLPDINIQVGELSQNTHLGKHTTSASRLYHLSGGGSIIDSPGVRDFGLWNIPTPHIIFGFKEFKQHLGRCKFSNCTHKQEPDCAIKIAVENGLIHPQRLANYQAIMQKLKNK